MNSAEVQESKPRFKSFTYRTSLDDVRGRSAMMHSGGKPAVAVSSPLEFKGDPSLWSPEDLFVASVEICLMLTFVGLAEKAGVRYASYTSTAEGLLQWHDEGYRFSRVVVRPTILVDDAGTISAVHRVLEKAHETCLVARSIRSFVEIEPSVSVVTHSTV